MKMNVRLFVHTVCSVEWGKEQVHVCVVMSWASVTRTEVGKNWARYWDSNNELAGPCLHSAPI